MTAEDVLLWYLLNIPANDYKGAKNDRKELFYRTL